MSYTLLHVHTHLNLILSRVAHALNLHKFNYMSIWGEKGRKTTVLRPSSNNKKWDKERYVFE